METREAKIEAETKLLAQLEAKCAALGFGYTGRLDDFAYPLAVISIPKGRDHRKITIYGRKRVEKILDLPVDTYKNLDGGDALWMPAKGTVESKVLPIDSNTNKQMVELLIGTDNEASKLRGVPIEIENSQFGPGIRAHFDTHSDVYRALFNFDPQVSLVFSGIQEQHHDAVVNIVKVLSDSLFFALYCRFGIAMHVGGRQERSSIEIPDTYNPMGTIPTSLRYKYDDIPMTLYWHAHGLIRTLPVFAFLAFYQVAEYYFPRYWELQARSQVKNIVKNPAFTPDNDDDISQVMKVLISNNRHSDELSFFVSVLRHCVGDAELQRFVDADTERAQHYARDKNLGLRMVTSSDHQADLCTNVAGRLYDLRCKLVHTKEYSLEESDRAIYLGSRLTKEIGREIELMEFVSRHILIASGAPL